MEGVPIIRLASLGHMDSNQDEGSVSPASNPALLKEAFRIRQAAWRQIVKAAQMLRDAEALEQGLFSTTHYEVLKCCSCYTAFPLWASEAGWLSARGMTPPRRCRDCRALRRLRRKTDARVTP